MRVNQSKLNIFQVLFRSRLLWGRALALAIPAAVLAALLAGCGGGGGGGGGGSNSGSTITVQGQVTDSFTDQAVPNAVVTLKGTSITTTADSNGNYSIGQIPANSNVTFAVTDPANNVTLDIGPITTQGTSPQTGVNLAGAFSLPPPPKR